MKRAKGWFLALAGLAILAASLVLSAPFPGHGHGTRRPEPAPVHPPGAAADPAAADPASSSRNPRPADPRSKYLPIQEAGVLRFTRDDPDAQLVFPVPPGRRLVLEQLSIRLQLAEGRRATALVTTQTGGGYATHVVPLAPFGPFPGKGDLHGAGQPLRAYADGGTQIVVRIERSAGSESDTGFVSWSGRFED